MRYINLHFTYLLTYLLTSTRIGAYATHHPTFSIIGINGIALWLRR